MRSYQGNRPADLQKADCLLEFFRAVCRRDQGTQVQTISQANPAVEMPDRAIAESEVLDSVKNMGAPKAASLDGSHPIIVKTTEEVLEKHFAQRLNASLGEGQLSANWVTSTDIPKHEDRDMD